MAEPQVTHDQWLAELETALATRFHNQGGGLTCRELCRITGMSLYKVNQLLHVLNDSGRLVVTRGYRTSIAGGSNSVPLYALKAAEKKKK